MNTATATAPATDMALTPVEFLAVIEQFGFSLYPPARGGGGGWMAGWKNDGYYWGWGDTAIAAVEDLLSKIGGANWQNGSL